MIEIPLSRCGVMISPTLGPYDETRNCLESDALRTRSSYGVAFFFFLTKNEMRKKECAVCADMFLFCFKSGTPK